MDQDDMENRVDNANDDQQESATVPLTSVTGNGNVVIKTEFVEDDALPVTDVLISNSSQSNVPVAPSRSALGPRGFIRPAGTVCPPPVPSSKVASA